MSNQGNYKRTVAGSVGAGMGAIFNGSGRTFYILEHKTQSKYHNLGESQKIIIDQIEMGRDSSCQVRFDEAFDTVSRKHAAIVRNGNNWELIHLSTSNPTLVNGRPIQGSYYLQSGDEIQLSVGGPRMGFIQPQGKQGLTSSIRLTERMNLFRQQALRPYRTALWILGALLVAAIVASTIMFCKGKEIIDEQQVRIAELTEQQTQATETVTRLDTQILDLEKQIAEAEKDAQKHSQSGPTVVYRNVGGGNSSQIDDLRRQLADLRREREDAANRLDAIGKELEEEGVTPRPRPIPAPTPINVEDEENEGLNTTGPNTNPTNASAYYNSIYRIIIENISVTDPDGVPRQSNINLNNIDCGNGFITPNGTFVTARQNIQPWLYVDGNTPPDNWRRRLAVLYGIGCDINIAYSAYSTDGPAQRLQFNSRDFNVHEGGDIIRVQLKLTEEDVEYIEGLGITAINKKQLLREDLDIKHISSSARAFALLYGTGRPGVPTDNGASNNLSGGVQLDIPYYTGRNVNNLGASVTYKSTRTSGDVTSGGTIRLQESPGSSALGAPVFFREADGSLMVIGVFVGNGRVIPISRCQ